VPKSNGEPTTVERAAVGLAVGVAALDGSGVSLVVGVVVSAGNTVLVVLAGERVAVTVGVVPEIGAMVLVCVAARATLVFGSLRGS